jgi:ankyrin repeat protein
VLEVLIDRRAVTDEVDEEGRSALHYAAQEGQVNAVRLLLDKKYEYDKRDRRGSTPLHHAAVRGQTIVILELLRSGANPLLTDMFGIASRRITPENHIQLQVDQGRTVAFIVPLIFPNLASRSTLVYLHGTALHRAIENGHIRAVECFLDNSRELIELTDGKGQTPLHWAAKGSQSDILRLLLEKGANVHAVDDMHQTALHCVAAVGPAGKTILLVLGDSAEYEPQHSKDRAEHQGSHGKSVCLLLESELDVDVKDITGVTALHLAAHF